MSPFQTLKKGGISRSVPRRVPSCLYAPYLVPVTFSSAFLLFFFFLLATEPGVGRTTLEKRAVVGKGPVKYP